MSFLGFPPWYFVSFVAYDFPLIIFASCVLFRHLYLERPMCAGSRVRYNRANRIAAALKT